MKKLILMLTGGLFAYMGLVSVAHAVFLEVIQEGNEKFIVGSILNQGRSTIMFDYDYSSVAFQHSSMPTPIGYFRSPKYKINFPENGFQNAQLRYGNTRGGCVFYFNSNGQSAILDIQAVPYGIAQCGIVNNNLIITVLGPPVWSVSSDNGSFRLIYQRLNQFDAVQEDVQ